MPTPPAVQSYSELKSRLPHAAFILVSVIPNTIEAKTK